MKLSYAEHVSALCGQFLASGYRVDQSFPGELRTYNRKDGRRFRVFIPDVDDPTVTSDTVYRSLHEAASRRGEDAIVLVMPTLLHLGQLSNGTSLQAAVNALNPEGHTRVFVRSYGQIFRDAFQQSGGSIGIDVALGEGRGKDLAKRAQSLFTQSPEEGDMLHPDTVSYQTGARVDQPYYVLAAEDAYDGSSSQGNDLFALLNSELEALKGGEAPRPDHISIDFISGRAAQGKSVLFSHLMQSQRALMRREQYPYPYPLYAVPHTLIAAERDLRQKGVAAVDALFESIAVAEADGAVSTTMLEWMVKEGLATLSFDGLDEFFFGQVGFMDALKERLLQPGSRAQIRIFLRDSLFSTDAALGYFIGNVGERPVVKIRVFELASWEGPDGKVRPDLLHQFAWLHTQGRKPEPGEADPPVVSDLVKAVSSSNTLGKLACSPFFLKLIADYDKTPREAGAIRQSLARVSELNLLEDAVINLFDREWSKILQADPDGNNPAVAGLATLSSSGQRVIDSIATGIARNVAVKTFMDAFGLPRTGPETDKAHSTFLIARRIDAARRDLRTLVEDLALAARRGSSGDYALSAEQIKDIYSRQNLPLTTSEGRERAQMILQRFALFSRFDTGEVQFTHEIIADYLAGIAAARALKNKPKSDIAEVIGKRPTNDTGYFGKVLLDRFPEGDPLHGKILKALG